MEPWLQLILTSIGSFGASSGFWAYVQHKDRTKSATARLLMGIAYKELTSEGLKYLDRGELTKDEYEEYLQFFFEPYKELGGNGLAERIANRVSELPIRSYSRYDEILRNRPSEGFINNVRVVTREEQNTTSE